MRIGFFPVLMSALLLCACEAADRPVQATHADVTTNVAAKDIETTIPDHHARIIALVEAGEAALADQDASKLFDVSQKLQLLGASPIGGTEDLAKGWVLMAHDLTPESDRQSIPFRGRIKGPAYRRHALAPGEQDIIEDIFYAAEPAEMTLKSMNNSTLEWEIAQDGTDDAPVCDGAVGDRAKSCRFLPLWTSKYRIRISNVSDQTATYLFVTN